MKSVLFSIFFILLFSIGEAQSFDPTTSKQIQTEVRKLMDEHRFLQANQLLNDYLTTVNNDPDAWVLKANLTLNEYRDKKPQLSIFTEPDDNIYDQTMGILGSPPLELPSDICDSIVISLYKGAAIAPNRTDIHMGICYLLSISKKTMLLVQYLPVLNASLPPSADNPYTLADYARNLIDRKSFEEGMQVYAAIVGLYPNNAGILSDMAGEYYKKGKTELAHTYIKMALKANEIDAMTYGNCFFIGAIVEDFPLAIDAIQKQCALTKSKEYLVYEALIHVLEGNKYAAGMLEFLKSPSNDESLIKTCKYMTQAKFAFSLADYDSLMHFDLADAYKLLICKHFMNRFPRSFAPAYQYAEILTYHGRLTSAQLIYPTINTTNCDSGSWFEYHLHAGWTQYKTNHTDMAVAHFLKLQSATDFYQYSASCYFLGIIAQSKGNEEEALSYFKLVDKNASENKFAMYCKWMTESMESGKK